MDWRRVTVAVESRAPTGETAVYLSDGPGALLVDPARRTADLDDAVAAADVDHVAVTHHHPDHVGAVAHYARETGATVWARRGRVDAFEAVTGIAPDRTFAEGTTIPAGDGIEVLGLPGHAPEHVGFETAAGVVSGDVAVAEGSVVVGAPEGDMRAYLASLRRLHARNPPRLYPGHGPTITEPRSACRRLLRHRLDREQRVRAAVESGAETPDDILDRAYEKDLTGVRDLARATVLAHLEKLAVEGALRWDGRRANTAGARS
ncbi:MBL fold metallo-hydrolase [Haloarcula onubensis]|uniref:MBL fold metallo-hydrolase n=1 Tax=Haloarcula onubensis TaxID=2950539 RepID=A0ABU2FK35_9EURY|nr:MBL fold metallo-hydrolase [Halomicroarcula sp. S3CR25-11]MDS0281097.1 MBL fold metallo-hydrolase [Halomicroarcula sp. S3CR25-11]